MILAAFIRRVTSTQCAIRYVAEWEVATVGLTPTGLLRLQAAPPEVCLGTPRRKGTRLSTPTAPSWLRPTGLPSRSRSSRESASHDGGDPESSTGPFLASGCVVRRVFGTTPRSARLGAAPRFRGHRLYGRPCRSRALQAGPSPSLLCQAISATTPSPLRRQGDSVPSHCFPNRASLRPWVQGATPAFPPVVRLHGNPFDAAAFPSCCGVVACEPPGLTSPTGEPGHDPRGVHGRSHLPPARDSLRGRMGHCHDRTYTG